MASISSEASAWPAGDAPPVREARPPVGLEWELALVPRPSSHGRGGLEQRELVRPGREAAVPAVAVKLPQDGHQRVVRRLVSEVVEVPCRGRRARPAPSYLGDGCAQKQRVQALYGGVALGSRRVERAEPGGRLGV